MMQQATDGNRIRPFAPPTVAPPVVVEYPAPAPAAPRWRAVVPGLLVAGCVFAGVGLRGYAYARNPSLWIDEAMLALNVVHRTPAELLRPLDLNQGAPVGYLMLAKLTVKAFGPGELSLRLPSLVAGVAALLVFVPLAYRALPLNAARLAVCLFALSPYLAGYSAEFKQYELDAAVAVGLMWLALPVWRGDAGKWRLVGFAVGGAVAVWFSHPSAFVLGGVGTAALADAAVRNRKALVPRLLVVAAWLVSFGACYWFFLRHLGLNPYLIDYWAGKFMPLPPTRPGDAAWVVHHFLEFFDKPGGFAATEFSAGGVAAVCWLVAAVVLVRENWRLLVALAAPLALAMLASGLQKYPFAGRLLLFAVPAMLLMVGYGAGVLLERLGRLAGGAALAVLFVAPVAECAWQLKHPIHPEDAREAIAHAHAHWQPGDRAYVSFGAAPALGYYHPRYPLPADAVRVGTEIRGDHAKFRADLEPLRGSSRVWVIVAHRSPAEEAALVAYLDAMGARHEIVRGSDAVVMRYSLK